MNWRRSMVELKRLYEVNRWLYVIEWRERVEFCIRRLEGVRGLSAQEVIWEAQQLRDAAADLIRIAEAWEEEYSKRVRIDALRRTEGRTPEEAETYRRKADELESALP